MAEHTWQVVSPAGVTAPAAGGEPSALNVSTPSTRRGVLIPFQRDRKSDVANGAGVPVIRSNVRQILGTRVGELKWRSKFGSKLHLIRHRTDTRAIQALARVYVIDALRTWETRVRVRSVTCTKVGRALNIHVILDVVDVNAPLQPVVAKNVDVDVGVQLAA